ncbi:uracil-xanthine permease family protein [Faecalibacillus intestinalis]|uniref:uracil-xanthine permease family protein n=1 Tax=Faecalibacillus intestinalis TaxID=1982626 RepID=UPI003522FB6A
MFRTNCTLLEKIITPIVAASVVTSIGFSLFSVGTRSFGGGYSESFGSTENLLLGTITLAAFLLFNIFAKSYWKQLSVLFGLIVGYILAIFMGKVDLSVIFNGGLIALSHLLPFKTKFDLGAIIAVVVIFLVSATETIGDTSALVNSGLNREVTEEEISDSLACDGFCSSISSLFGCPPITSFSQNIGLINITKVVNRFTIATGAICMILVGLLPPIGNFFSSLPESVLGGGTIMMFGTILTSGIEMIAKAGFNQRNVTIVALSLAVGIGFTSGTEADIWHIFPQIIQDVFAGNCVSVVFVVSIILSLVLPKDMDIKKIK